MMQINPATSVSLAALLLGAAGCSSEGQIDLGGTAGNGNSAGAASVPVSPAPLPDWASRMTVQLGETQYVYAHLGAATGYGEIWQGPDLRADSSDPNGRDWPLSNPILDLSVLFTGFVRGEGFPLGTYDLAQPVTQKVIVILYVASQAEVPLGQTAPYAIYSSTPAEDPYNDPPTIPAVGVSGTVTLVEHAPDTQDVGTSRFDLSISNVVLPINTKMGDYPSTTTIESAHLKNRPP